MTFPGHWFAICDSFSYLWLPCLKDYRMNIPGQPGIIREDSVTL